MDDINVGDSAFMRRTIVDADIANFAGVSGDFNPVHVDDTYAQGTMFKGRIAHGMLMAAFISNVLGNQLPGNGCIYVKQELRFTAPVRVGDTITARVEVIEKKPEKKRVVLKTTCTNQHGEDVLVGQAEMMIPS